MSRNLAPPDERGQTVLRQLAEAVRRLEAGGPFRGPRANLPPQLSLGGTLGIDAGTIEGGGGQQRFAFDTETRMSAPRLAVDGPLDLTGAQAELAPDLTLGGLQVTVADTPGTTDGSKTITFTNPATGATATINV